MKFPHLQAKVVINLHLFQEINLHGESSNLDILNSYYFQCILSPLGQLSYLIFPLFQVYSLNIGIKARVTPIFKGKGEVDDPTISIMLPNFLKNNQVLHKWIFEYI